MKDILSVADLAISFDTYAGEVKAVQGVSFLIKKGESIALVGESGCGKSVTAKAIMGLLQDKNVHLKEGSKVYFDDKNIYDYSEEQWRDYRGGKCSIIFQDAMTSLNPTKNVGSQIAQNIRIHKKVTPKDAWCQAVELLESVGIPDSKRSAKKFPHEFSGGQRQRIMISIAISCKPDILLADEPTTALDVTIQAQILSLLKKLKDKHDTSLIMITHDLGIVADMSERIMVMYCGKIVEQGTSDDIFYSAAHPYTNGLLRSVPRLDSNSKDYLYTIEGTAPNLVTNLSGCSFSSRCHKCMNICLREEPAEFQISPSHKSCCWLHAKNNMGNKT